MQTMKLSLVALIVAPALAGCGYMSYLTPPSARPIIEDHAAKQLNTFAVQPSRRMVIVKSNINNNGDLGSAAVDKGLLRDNAVLVCAEASPDVADDIAASVAAAVAAKGSSSAASAPTGELGASYANALAISGQALFKRSQSLQFYRDAAYHLCQAKVNGFIKDHEYLREFQALVKDAKELLTAETPWLYLTQATAPEAATRARESAKAAIPEVTVTMENGSPKVVLRPSSAKSDSSGSSEAQTGKPADPAKGGDTSQGSKPGPAPKK